MTYLKYALSVLLTFFIYVIGGFDIAIQSLIIVIIIDYLTGLASAFYNKKVNSKLGLRGIIKKVCYLLLVMLAVVVDNITTKNGIIRNLVIYLLVANDGISILENLGKMDIKYPKRIFEALEQLKKESE